MNDQTLDRLIAGFVEYGPILTTDEVAEMLSLSVQEVRKLTREGRMPARKIGKAYRYFRDEIVSWLNEQTPR